MKRWLLYINAFLLLAVVCLLFGFSQYENQRQKLSEIEVVFKGEQALFLTSSMVNKMLIQSEEKLLNKEKSKINLYNIEQKLKKNQMLENAEVCFTPNGKLQAQITQRVPIARIEKNSKSYYLDRRGKAMPLSPNYTARVPLVTGIYDEKMEKECFDLIQKLRADEFYKKQIIGLHRKDDGNYMLSTRIGKHKILFGRPYRVAEKMRKLKIFYKKEWGSESLDKYRLINLKYKHQVVCST